MPLTMLQIAQRFGGTAPHSLNEYYGVAAGVPTSGQISFSDFNLYFSFSVAQTLLQQQYDPAFDK